MKKIKIIMNFVFMLMFLVIFSVTSGCKLKHDNTDQEDNVSLTFKENISNLMSSVKMGNENFVGFSLIESADIDGSSKALEAQTSFYNTDRNYITYLSSEKEIEWLDEQKEVAQGSTFIVFDDEYNGEEIYFEKIDSTDNVSLDDISEFGTITRFYIMDKFLYVQITSNDYVESNEIKEDDYFVVDSNRVLFVIDLQTRNLYSINDALADILTTYGRLEVSMENGLIGVNLYIIGKEIGYYEVGIENETLTSKKVADPDDLYASHLLTDKYGNRYLIDNEYSNYDLDKINQMGIFTILVEENDYEYFLSTDRIVYRALKTSLKYSSYRYTYVERLQEDKTWALETETNDKILKDQLTYNDVDAFYGGDYMLIDGNIVRIAVFLGTPLNSCYNFDGQIYATIHLEGNERIIHLGSVDQLTEDYEPVTINNESYKNFTSVVNIEEDTNSIYLSILKSRTGYVLRKFDERYKIIVNDGEISFEKITPIYNGFEFLKDIVYS